MTMSFSRCHTFENCRYEWYMNYLLKDENGKRFYENEQNFYGAFGNFCHDILENILNGEMTEAEAFEYYQEHFDEKVGDYVVEISPATADKYYYFGYEYFQNVSFDWLKDYEILGVEKKCNFEIDGVKVTGFIDLLIRHKETGKIIVIDHKSAEYPLGKKGGVLKRKQGDYESYKRQLYMYSRQVYEEYGVYPDEIAWNYFRDSKWLSLPFKMDEYLETQKWFNDLIDEIHKEENFAPHLDFFYCSNLCGFRKTCDYKNMG